MEAAAAELLAEISALPPSVEPTAASEVEWPPEMVLPPSSVASAEEPIQPPPSPRLLGEEADVINGDESGFLESIMEAAGISDPVPIPVSEVGSDVKMGPEVGVVPQVVGDVVPEVEVVVKRKRGRPPKNKAGGAVVAAKPAAAAARKKADDEEVVCFICFDGGNLVVCDRRGCPKVYHPACVKRDESFFRSRGKWNCGWHICSSCEKAAHYMCYTCTYSLCKGCIKAAKFFCVRGNKGLCDTCFGTIMLIESKEDDTGTKGGVDFDDKTSWEYLFKLYWLDQKGKLSLTLDELKNAKSKWNGSRLPTANQESSDELYDANNDHDANSDSSSGRRKRSGSSARKGRKRSRSHAGGGNSTKKAEVSIKVVDTSPKPIASKGTSLGEDTKWASLELLELVGHMRGGDKSFLSQFDVQALLLEYIKQNNLRDPRRKSQIICDARLHNLFRKPRVGHFEMLKLLELHFLAKDASQAGNDDGQRGMLSPDSTQLDIDGCDDNSAKTSSDKRRRTHKKMEREPQNNLDDYAAVDVHNINLIYLRRSLVEDLIDDDATFSEKIAGAFVRIRICGISQKQDMYRLVKIIGTNMVSEKYKVGKKITNIALEILNLDKKEVISIDTISNQDFTEEECRRLRQSIKCGLYTRLKVGDLCEKAKILQSARVSDWLENEKLRLSHLRDRASETGSRKQLRECVEKLHLLSTPEERARRINELPEVHADPKMNPDYESAEERDEQKAADRIVSSWKEPSTSKTVDKSAAVNGFNDLHSANGWGAPKPHAHANNMSIDIANCGKPNGVAPSSHVSLLSSISAIDQVWHYKDPSGNIHGPFPLVQLDKWTDHFPLDLRIWHMSETQENSLLLTDVLARYQNSTTKADPQQNILRSTSGTIGSASAHDCSGNNKPLWEQHGPNLSLEQISASFAGTENSTPLASQSTNYSASRREDVNSQGTKFLPWEHPKESNAIQCQVGHQGYAASVASSSACFPGGGVQGGSSEPNNGRDSRGMWSPSRPQTSSPGTQSLGERYPTWHASGQQHQHDSTANWQARSAIDSTSQWTHGSFGLPTPTPQQRGRDSSNPTSSASVLSTATKTAGSCWSSTTKLENCGEHHSLKTSMQPKSSASSGNIGEDWSSNPPSSMVIQSEKAYGWISWSAPSDSTSNTGSMIRETMDQHTGFEASNTSTNQSPVSKCKPITSVGDQDLEQRKCPSPTRKSEMSEHSVSPSGSTEHENKAAKIPDHKSSVALASETSDPATCVASEIDISQSNSRVEALDKKDGNSINQIEELNREARSVEKQDHFTPTSSTEPLATTGILESLKEGKCQASNLQDVAHFEEFSPGSAEVEEPQCSSPIALSPWGEPSFFQGETVDSSLWDVQDDPSNGLWSLPSPTPASKPLLVIEAEDKHVTCQTDMVMAAHGNSDVAQRPLVPGDQNMERASSTAIPGWGVPQQVKSRQSAGSQASIQGNTSVPSWGSSTQANLNLSSIWGGTTSQNWNLASGWGAAAPTAKNSTDAPTKQGITDASASWGAALGSTNKSWNISAGSADWGNRGNRNDHRYPEDGESWRGNPDHRRSGNSDYHRGGHSDYSRSRMDGTESGWSSRPSSRGQSQRGICKFYEGGYCKKGASCNYLHS